MKRVFRKPHKIKKKILILKNRFFWPGVLILIILVGISYLICFSIFFQIKEIKISGNQKVSIQDLYNVIQSQIERKILFFPTKSIFLTDFKSINNTLLAEFPQIVKTELKRDFPNVIEIKVEERAPIAFFSQNEKYFSIDKEGIIFEETQPNGSLPKIINNQITSPSLGQKIIEKDYLDKILKIEKKFIENFKIKTIEFNILNDRLSVRTEENWEVYFNLNDDIDSQLTNLSLILEKEIFPESREKLEYIELRFGSRVYYKYRQ